MKVMFLGDLAGTGFGTVTQDLGRALLALGLDLRFVSQNELGELPEPFASRTFTVNDEDGWLKLKNNGGVIGLLDGRLWQDGWVPDAAIVLGDWLNVALMVLADEHTRAIFERIPTIHYVPIEGVDLPPAWGELWDIVVPVAMSEFGADQIEKVTGSRPTMIYHGIDTAQFRPITPEKPLRLKSPDGEEGVALRSKADCKRLFGADPRHRWIFRADRHMPRKRYNELFRSLAPVVAARPDTFLVYHCRSKDEGGDLDHTKSKYPPAIRAKIVNTGFHDQMGGASRDILTALYNAADLYVSNSAEGFGLTIAEAIACGTPAVGLRYSAVPEVIGPAGITVPPAGLVDNEYDHFWAAADQQTFGQAVGALLDDEVTRKRMGRLGPDHVRQNFQWDRAAIAMSGLIRDHLAGRAVA